MSLARAKFIVAQLDGSLVEGAIPIDALPDGPYHPDARETALASAARTFAIGAAITVRVTGTDPALGRVEFELAE
jgi:ribonuclease R